MSSMGGWLVNPLEFRTLPGDGSEELHPKNCIRRALCDWPLRSLHGPYAAFGKLTVR